MLNHIDKRNNPIIVDVGNKEVSSRVAEAEGEIKFNKQTFDQIESLKSKKGSINNIAIIAGIMGAKKTSSIIPLCHNIQIDSIKIEINKNFDNCSLKVKSIVKTSSKTGVEMEALTAVSVSCLTIYDMCKYLSNDIIIDNIRLIYKSGGKKDFISKKTKK